MDLLGFTPALVLSPQAIVDEATKSGSDYNTFAYLRHIRQRQDLPTSVDPKEREDRTQSRGLPGGWPPDFGGWPGCWDGLLPKCVGGRPELFCEAGLPAGIAQPPDSCSPDCPDSAEYQDGWPRALEYALSVFPETA